MRNGDSCWDDFSCAIFHSAAGSSSHDGGAKVNAKYE
jgi:hypothetical protein